jgi:hypothetical protein
MIRVHLEVASCRFDSRCKYIPVAFFIRIRICSVSMQNVIVEEYGKDVKVKWRSRWDTQASRWAIVDRQSAPSYWRFLSLAFWRSMLIDVFLPQVTPIVSAFDRRDSGLSLQCCRRLCALSIVGHRAGLCQLDQRRLGDRGGVEGRGGRRQGTVIDIVMYGANIRECDGIGGDIDVVDA